MALVKCPDCGKMVSERAETCPNCGCPAKYFEHSEKENVKNDSIKEDDTINQNEDIAIFNLAGYEVKLPVDEKQKVIASILGIYLQMGDASVQELNKVYRESKNIKKALIDVSKAANEMMTTILDNAVNVLFKLGVTESIDEFAEKYYYQKGCAYEECYNVVVEGYAKIMGYQDELASYRQEQKMSRGRWQGGGFGLKGAIKGAVTAQVMNAGSDFIHSFGDNAREKQDRREVAGMLQTYYEDDDTRACLCDVIGECILNVYLALLDELIDKGVIDKHTFEFDTKKADTIFENAIKYSSTREEKVKNVLESIMWYPGEKSHYNAIIGELLANDTGEGTGGFLDFLKYWGIEWFYPQNDVEELELTNELVDKVLDEANYTKSYWGFCPMSSLNEHAQKKIKVKIRTNNPGQYLICGVFDENDDVSIIVTSAYFYDLPIVSLKKILYERKISDGKYSLLIILKDDKPMFGIQKFSMEIPFGSIYEAREFALLMNILLRSEDAEEEWKNYKLEDQYNQYIKTQDLPDEITNMIEYHKVRSLLEYAANDCNMESISVNNPMHAMLVNLIKNIPEELQIKLRKDSTLYDWIRDDATREEFFEAVIDDNFAYELFADGYLVHSAWFLYYVTKYYIPDKILNEFGKVYFYKDFSYFETGAIGFAVTDDSIISLKDQVKFDIKDIENIQNNENGDIEISDHEKSAVITRHGLMWDEYKDAWGNPSKNIQVITVLKKYCILFGNNNLSLADTSDYGENSNTVDDEANDVPSIDDLLEVLSMAQGNSMATDKKETEPIEQNKKNMMFCIYCGKKISRTAKFCNFCGKANKYKEE